MFFGTSYQFEGAKLSGHQKKPSGIALSKSFRGKCRGKFIHSLINYMYLQESEER